VIKSLIIDNYDSFTFNLYQLLGQVNGEAPLVVKNDELEWSALRRLDFDNVVISPGPGRPDKHEDFGVCADAIVRAEVPVLGVCLGHQGIALCHGARLAYAPEPMHGRISRIHHRGEDLLAGVPSPFSAVRYHSLVVSDDLPGCLEKIAWTDDGLVMALRHRERPLWGLQFHPESISTEYGFQMLKNFRAITERHLPPRARGTICCRTTEAAHEPAPRRIGADRDERFALRVRKLANYSDPEAVFVKLFGGAPAAFWLDSSMVKDNLARFSFMGDACGPNSQMISYDAHAGRMTVEGNRRTTARRESIFSFLQRELACRHVAGADLPFAFNCGFVGYLGYEMKRECGASFAHRAPFPDARFLLADRIVAFDHQERQIYLTCLERLDTPADADSWFDRIEREIASISGAAVPVRGNGAKTPRFEWRHSPDAYRELIEECQRQMALGESYEICLTNKISTAVELDPLAIYRVLRRLNPAPYSAFMLFNDFAILSSSPEKFLSVDASGVVESKPIKGTAPRGRSEARDLALREALRMSDKNRAENLMIVDLVRNDLGRVCELGSVEVPDLMEVESYATVHHLVSTIRGRLRPNSTAIDAVRAAFPPGSMTGAPKLRTMEIIDRLEGAARGIYSGTIGFFALSGAAELAVVIRTMVMTPKEVSFGTGGAIVALSDPAEELEEIRLKAETLIAAISAMCDHGPPKGS
jgi:para-aminobenzoate synthetase